MSENVFSTGVSSGLGRGLAEAYLDREATVFGLSRRGANIKSHDFREAQVDLADLEGIPAALDALLGDVALDVAILNAGMLGEFKAMPELGLEELRRAMDINVWANKQILDWLVAHNAPGEIVLVS